MSAKTHALLKTFGWYSKDANNMRYLQRVKDVIVSKNSEKQKNPTFLVLYRPNLTRNWETAIEDAAIAATLYCTPWVGIDNGSTIFIMTNQTVNLKAPLERIQWQEERYSPLLQKYLLNRQTTVFENNQNDTLQEEISSEWTHVIPLAKTKTHDQKTPKTYLRQTTRGAFIILKGSSLKQHLANALLNNADTLEKCILERTSMKPQASNNTGYLVTQKDSVPLSRSVAAMLALGRIANGQIAGVTYGTSNRNDEDIIPKHLLIA